MRAEVAQGERFLFGALAAAAALLLECFCWGFTVDDAWIVSRVAAHGADTGVFSFNAGKPPTDAVTPLGWAHLLGHLGHGLGLTEKHEFWTLARALGVVAYVASFGLAGYFSAQARGFASSLTLVTLVLLCVPAGLWAGAGLATPLVGFLLVVGAIVLERGKRLSGAFLLGMGAAWRPELVPFVGAVLLCQGRERHWCCRVQQVFVSAVPTLGMMAFRWLYFESALPLSSVAKQADWESGVRYALVTCIWIGVPWLLLLGLTRRHRRWFVLAWGAHLVALVFAGGDWMPGLRLSAALLPWVVWRAAPLVQKRWHLGAVLLVAIFPLRLLWTQGEELRRVSERRWALVESARGELQGYSTIAAVDIGWVGMASDAEIVDLAGVSDPRIARLPGGHTSKAVFPGMFSGREVDAWVVRAAQPEMLHEGNAMSIEPQYWVDARLLQRVVDLNMSPQYSWNLAGAPGGYVLFASRKED